MTKDIRDFNPPRKKKRAVPHQINTRWDDLRTPAYGVKKVLGKEPTDQAYKGGVVQSFVSGADNAVAFTVQLPHSYKEESDLCFHLHVIIPTAGAGGAAENVKFDFTYSWANIDGVFPAETPVSVTTDVKDIAADTHFIIEFPHFDGTGKTISSVLICSLTRDTGVANNYADDIYLSELDFHFEKDSNGSRWEWIK